MFNVSEAAQQAIKDILKDKEIKPIRIFVNQGGCCGPAIAMGLDEIRETDSVFDIDGVQYVVDKALLTQAQPISVDFAGDGFAISSNLKFDSGCSSCGSGSGSCS